MTRYEYQWQADLVNPDFQQEIVNEHTEQEADAFNARVNKGSVTVASINNSSLGIAPDQVAVARAMVEGVLKGWIDTSTNQSKADAIYYTARHEGIQFAGVPEEWLTPEFTEEVFALVDMLIERYS